MLDVNIKITDRNGVTHEVAAPTDMAMNLMEIVKLYELAEEGTIGVCGGMAMCASCQCYVKVILASENLMKKKKMLSEAYNVKENSRLGCQIHIYRRFRRSGVELAPYE